MTLHDLRKVLNEAGIPVAHYKTQLTEYPYIIYRETGTSYNIASGKAWREIITVSVDHITKIEFDPSLEKLKLALLKNKIMFTTATVWYEADELIETQIDFTISREMEV